MQKDILIHDEQSGTKILCLESGPYAGKSFSAKFGFCDNPICRCYSVTFCCFPLDAGIEATKTPLEFTLDIEKKRVQKTSKHKASKDTLLFAKALIKAMSEADWNLLAAMFRRFKARRTEEADYTTLTAPFPVRVVRNPSLLVHVVEVLPWIRPFNFNLGQDCFLMNDFYCCNPDCDCEEVIVDFECYREQANGKFESLQTTASAFINTRTGTVKPVHSPWEKEPALETLFRSLLEANPGVVAQLAKRHHDLRLLYKNTCEQTSKAFSLWNEQPIETGAPFSEACTPKPQPNDLCPCGSGRKYKKCCGRLG